MWLIPFRLVAIAREKPRNQIWTLDDYNFQISFFSHHFLSVSRIECVQGGNLSLHASKALRNCENRMMLCRTLQALGWVGGNERGSVYNGDFQVNLVLRTTISNLNTQHSPENRDCQALQVEDGYHTEKKGG